MAVADDKFVVNYFRLSEDRRLLFGGRESYSIGFPKDILTALRARMERLFPQLARCGHHPSLGRDTGDHHEPGALSRAALGPGAYGGGDIPVTGWRCRFSAGACWARRSSGGPLGSTC